MSDVGERSASGDRRRRLWSTEEKRRIIAESLEPGASAAAVARRYGLNANLLFTWRRQQAAAAAAGTTDIGQPVKIVPVTVVSEMGSRACAQAPELVGRMEIVLGGGERIIVGLDVDAAALARVIKTLARR